MTLVDRLTARITVSSDGCWLWNRPLNDGYGQISVGSKNRRVHVVVWEIVAGPVPDGLELDHLCRNRACVNPAHLEPVTHRVNSLRGESPWAQQARQTHCKRGHEFSPWNTIRGPRNSRRCRRCHNEKQRRYKRERRALGREN